jgi:ABC-2 type transport system permease protein
MNIKSVLFYRFAYLFELISIFVSLIIYYFTSKAFSGSVDSSLAEYNVDYFSYIVLGEVFLAIPLYFLEGPFRNLKTAVIEGTWETMISLPKSPFKSLVYVSTFDFPRVALRCCVTLLMAILFFGLKISILDFLQVSLLQVMAIPFCFGFGLVACSIFLLSGRGQSFIGYLTTFTAFFSGGFFPISVFPNWLREASYYFSPFTFLLENSRQIIAGTYGNQHLLGICIHLTFWSVTFFVGHFAVSRALLYRKRVGGSIIVSN